MSAPLPPLPGFPLDPSWPNTMPDPTPSNQGMEDMSAPLPPLPGFLLDHSWPNTMPDPAPSNHRMMDAALAPLAPFPDFLPDPSWLNSAPDPSPSNHGMVDAALTPLQDFMSLSDLLNYLPPAPTCSSGNQDYDTNIYPHWDVEACTNRADMFGYGLGNHTAARWSNFAPDLTTTFDSNAYGMVDGTFATPTDLLAYPFVQSW
jgi:hypothetical protein